MWTWHKNILPFIQPFSHLIAFSLFPLFSFYFLDQCRLITKRPLTLKIELFYFLFFCILTHWFLYKIYFYRVNWCWPKNSLIVNVVVYSSYSLLWISNSIKFFNFTKYFNVIDLVYLVSNCFIERKSFASYLDIKIIYVNKI